MSRFLTNETIYLNANGVDAGIQDATWLTDVKVGERHFIYAKIVGFDLTVNEAIHETHSIHIFEKLEGGAVQPVLIPNPLDPSFLTPAVVQDNEELNIEAFQQPHVAEVAGSHFLVVTGYWDDGLSVFRIDPLTGLLSNTDNVSLGSDSLYNRPGVGQGIPVEVGDATYVLVNSSAAQEVNVFELNSDGALSEVGAISHETTSSQIDTIAHVDGKVFAVMDAGVFEMSSSGDLIRMSPPLLELLDDSAREVFGHLEFLAVDGTSQLVGFNAHGLVSFDLNASGQVTQLSEFAFNNFYPNYSPQSVHDVNGRKLLVGEMYGYRHYETDKVFIDYRMAAFEIDANGVVQPIESEQYFVNEGGESLYRGETFTLDGVEYLIPATRHHELVEITPLSDDTPTADDSTDDTPTSEPEEPEQPDVPEPEPEPEPVDPITVIEGDTGRDDLEGGDGSEALFGYGGRDQISGGNGDDKLLGGEGNDKLYGGEGADLLDGGDDNDQAYGDAGDDTLDGGEGNDKLYGGEGADLLDGGDDNDRAYGDAGDDSLDGGEGRDALYGGDGEDILQGGEGADRLQGDAGDDQLTGGVGDDRARGGDGDDQLYGDDGKDNLRGDDGDDLIQGGAGDDRADGGNGKDVLEGQSGDDLLNGRNGDDLLLGGEGDDRASGGNNDDTIVGGAGDDDLRGDRGDDRVVGGDGDDRARGGSGADSILGGEGDDALDGQRDDDDIDGGAGDDDIEGGSGDDNLFGRDGNDVLDGERDDDQLSGGEGADTLLGGRGDDELIGGEGDDVLVGERGADSFVFAIGDGEDVIEDLDDEDVIQIHGSSFSAINLIDLGDDIWRIEYSETDGIEVNVAELEENSLEEMIEFHFI